MGRGGDRRFRRHAQGPDLLWRHARQFANTYDRVVDQVVDIGFILTAFAAGKFKQQDVAALPFEAENAILASNACGSSIKRA